jgi:hypothetical protein
VFEVGGRLALIQVREHREPDAERLATAIAAERERLRQERRQARIGEWIDARRRALESAGGVHVNLAALEQGR